jgi:hypothetical protein
VSRLDTYSADCVALAEGEVTASEAFEIEFAPHHTTERVTASSPAGWNPWLLVGFRIAFLYFCGFLWLFGNFPVDFSGINFWPQLGEFFNWPLNHLAIWTAHYVFHIPHIPAHWHMTTLGDRLIDWVLDSLLIAVAVIGGLAWTAIAWFRGNHRTEYRTLLAWIRFLLRLSAGFFMFGYGMVKVFPLQMAPISIATLNEPFGQLSREILLWSFVGLIPAYQIVCGVAETLAGGLLLFRRTALAGALLAIFLMSNVVLYDYFFDVGVRLFACNLLLAEIFIVLPDAQALLDFFWRHKAAAQSGVWTPPLTGHRIRMCIRAIEVAFIAGCFIINPLFDGILWHHRQVIARTQSPLLGGWRVDSGQPPSGPFLTPDGPAAELYLDTVQRALRRSGDGMLWRAFVSINPTAHTLFINGYSDNPPVTYHWRMPDADHLVLNPIAPKQTKQAEKAAFIARAAPVAPPSVVTLTRIPLPAHYRLLDRTFRFVNNGATER